MVPFNNLGPGLSGKAVNETRYRGMIGSRMYLTTSRHDIQFSTCLCARYQANPKESYLIVVKRIFRYLKGTPSLGLWYSKCSGFDLKGYSDSDYAGCNMDRKITSGACQLLGGKLVCWSAKKQQSVAISSAEAEYCCANILWIKSQLTDYDIIYEKLQYCLKKTEARLFHSKLNKLSCKMSVQFLHKTFNLLRSGSRLDTVYWGFLGIGTTLDIFQNIILIPYLKYGVLILSGYSVLIFILYGHCSQALFHAERVPQGIKPGAKPGHKKHLSSSKQPSVSSKDATKGGSSKAPTGSKTGHLKRTKENGANKGGSSKAPTGSKTGHLKRKKESSSAMDSNPSQTSASTLVVAEMHKEDQQATSSPTSLGVTSEARVNPQLRVNALQFPQLEADPGESALVVLSSSIPADYVSAGHVLVPADSDRIC
ncbi:hypothetical protein Tco_1238323 [Tanacetum coccineum]